MVSRASATNEASLRGAGQSRAMNADSLTLVALVFLLAGLVKGVVGLGLPTVSVGLLALVMPPAEAAALLILPSVVTNVAQA
jgi:hypothetical protein